MKQCPKCSRRYPQEQIHCYDDGSILINEFDSEATIVRDVPKDSFTSRNINLLHFSKWSRNEKLTFLGFIVAILSLLIAFMALRSPSPSPVEQCVLYNDAPGENFVRARRDCDVKKVSCQNDETTSLLSFPNNTEVRKVKDSPVIKEDRYRWVRVEHIEKGGTFWVADTKLKCK